LVEASIPGVQFQDEHKRLLGRGGLIGQLNDSFDRGGSMLIRLLQSQSALSLAGGLAMEGG